ncbi:MAG: cysteine desulfurase [Candidatus Omnitrophica bacterium]|nr:cysteine desulfurase [Candidatus Omnitrophota bacterium]MDE2009359.1 cysteine desulfurase [Candidatus Omnitrophota bacterium]MDE2214143.1 cysteine desulfurase [Candidatus Omnitrophota bacterium]MDE2231180.1 cysteine desulfurase [Candidatus Omnitrophota bacterium]
MSSFDAHRYRAEFPNLRINVHGKPLVYLDNAATTLKPRCVVDAVNAYYVTGVSNVHRGVHFLSEQATAAFEYSRQVVRQFLHAPKAHEIIFTKGATESLNLVAQSFGRQFLKKGDEIIISYMEHHSNIVPWQMLCEQAGCVLKVIPINERGEIIFEEYLKLLSRKTRLVAVVWVSNSLGTVNPIKAVIDQAHRRGAVVVIDAAQGVTHAPTNVQELDCDFLAFSGHKVLGPTGVGVLYGKEKWLEAMPPYQGGGDMIKSVTFSKTLYNALPYKFEAGTPPIAEVIGLRSALEFLQTINWEGMKAYKQELLDYGTQKLLSIDGVRLIGTARDKTSILSFVVDGIHPHDLGTIVDQDGVAIRTGHHCTQPVMEFFKVPATARASLAFYNTKEEIDVLAGAVVRAKEVFHA